MVNILATGFSLITSTDMDVKTWSVAELETLLSKNGFSESTTTILKANDIDGESLILLNFTDVASFGLKIVPVTKLRGLIQSLRQQKENITNSPVDADYSQQSGNVIVNEGNG
ncbi:hypothetical protein DAPPUDRAFT_259578 [Daphnia pulex]|uniref:SAM domain-containing protein n=1 Tax=Daphnia pulex TaxID=6669 RepID=E9HHG1_DAPPU|nr:hypothetical protein DAPPUDRAFT_259578 [Daphnia pulex]|eukprot:EFX68770.1 hypothetical protein DAPPUDRAFT_259578 [Daphnia pulex]